MSKEQIKKKIEQVKNASKELSDSYESLQKVRKSKLEYGIHFDATVKRFEVLFEYVWKLLKVVIEYQGNEAPGPRPAIQEAVHFGWIDNPELWAKALEARNGSVHDYFGVTEKEYLEIIKEFSQKLAPVLEKIESYKLD